MLRTLHWYIIKDLLRVAGLALVAFTLLMTVFAIVEPLRKEGLATGQVAALFVYTLPVMLSFTMPFAALFAASMVYGRFAQDREMLACRASGISIITVLQPAVALGAVVMVISLVLTNFVSPIMLKAGEQAVVKNIKRIAYHKIKKDAYVKLDDKTMIHATYVDEKNNVLWGVVAARMETKLNQTGQRIPVLKVVVAQKAYLDTVRDPKTDIFYASVFLENVAGPFSNIPGGVQMGEEVPFENIEIPSRSEDKPAFYSWGKLLATLDDITKHGEIQRRMGKIAGKIRRNRMLSKLVATINAHKPFKDLHRSAVGKGQADEQLVLIAPKASVDGSKATLFSEKMPDGRLRRVQLQVVKGSTVKVYSADTATVIISKPQVVRPSRITIELRGRVSVPVHKGDTEEAVRKSSLTWGQIVLPDDAELDDVPLGEIYRNPERFTKDLNIQASVTELRQSRAGKIKGEIIAEMHARIAFGISCVFLVAMGAALGIVFRGGQVLVAFVVALVPAVIMLILIMMGKKMISNPKSSEMVGVFMIWGGIVAMAVADVVIYYRLSRK
ncbi:MAG: LptF/LptG family permease [Phycisphaerae bacterium]|nr:LptF/LptG family permease [Phycisphaerae bacterium]